MFEIGRVCVKIAGRDAGKTAIVVDKASGERVLIDGNVRRRKCNIKHLEPLQDILKLKKGASTSEVHKVMIAAKIKVEERLKVKRTKKKDIKQTKR
jgi:large subunit ribosomal protein L14e